jgi:hypothetical protein
MSYFYTFVEFNETTKKLICLKDDTGQTWWLAEHENDEKYLEWLEKGNTPEPWTDNA